MCLETNDSIIYTAEEDIIVYKHAVFSKLVLHTPYQRERIKVGKVINALDEYGNQTCMTLMKPSKFYATSRYSYMVHEGIHSFVSKESALKDLLKFDIKFSETVNSRVVFECIIPKGTKYIKGFFDNNSWNESDAESIVSERIIYKKIIKKVSLTFIQKLLIFFKCV